jgi:hypothetical protein
VAALTIPKDQPVSIERAIIGRTRTCRIFAGLFIGSGSFSTGTVWTLSFWALAPTALKIRQQSPRK